MQRQVTEKQILIDYLEQIYPHKLAKTLLSHKKVKVDGTIITQYNTILNSGQKIEINENKKTDLMILYEDKDILVVDKPHNLLTVATEKDQNTLYHLVREYVKKQNKHNKIFIVHRLDKETSGILVFAKSEAVQTILQSDWSCYAKERIYTAIVEGITPSSGTIALPLKENKMHQVSVSKTGKVCITHYKKIKSKKDTLVEILIKTGKKNQIRVHMSYIGHPIAGDIKYGAQKRKRMYLHASKLVLIHPISKKEMVFLSEVPFQL